MSSYNPSQLKYSSTYYYVRAGNFQYPSTIRKRPSNISYFGRSSSTQEANKGGFIGLGFYGFMVLVGWGLDSHLSLGLLVLSQATSTREPNTPKLRNIP